MEKKSAVMRDKFDIGALVTKNSSKNHISIKKNNSVLNGGKKK